MNIEILVHTAATDSPGAHAAARLARTLAPQHRLTLVAVRGGAMAHQALRLPETVDVVALAPSVPSDAPHEEETSKLIAAGDPEFRRYTRGDDLRLDGHLSASDADVVIALSSALGMVLAQCPPPHARRVVRQPTPVERMPQSVRERWTELYRDLDAVVPLTRADAGSPEYATLRAAGVEVRHIPEPVVLADGPDKPPTQVVISAGRLVPHRRIDIALHAFARAHAAHPHWQLRVFGSGPLRREVRDLVIALRLHDHVLLVDREATEEDFHDAEIALATAERWDSAHPALHAMAQATPVVATDAPAGAAEVLASGRDGLLVPVADVLATARALERYMADPRLRAAHGAQARHSAETAAEAAVSDAYEDLFQAVRAGARGRWGRRRRRDTGPVVRSKTPPTADCHLLGNGIWQLTLRGVDNTRSVRIKEQGKGRTGVVETPVTDGGMVARVDAPALAVLAEGRADVYAVDSKGRERRLRYGSCTLAGARDVSHLGALHHFHWVLPYVTEGGFLRLRIWSRSRHAELLSVEYGDRSMWLVGWLHGGWQPGAQPQLLLRRRQEPQHTIVVGAARIEDGWFGAELSAEATMRARLLIRENWDVLLADGSDMEPVRVARIADDQVARRDVQRFPELVNEESADLFGPDAGRSVVGLRPYLTADNELSLVVTEHD
ncbi:glycosyltransferase [Streptomyces sp. NPDC056910]|uniref:glycosyltransferase n=1 Tax=Streptomyces sp. NPDC056910 TaxID=3345964 RepID=UPI003681B038